MLRLPLMGAAPIALAMMAIATFPARADPVELPLPAAVESFSALPAVVPVPVPRPAQSDLMRVIRAPALPVRVAAPLRPAPAYRFATVSPDDADTVRPGRTSSALDSPSCQSLICPRFVLMGVGY